MTEKELRQSLLTDPVPDEIEAQRRSWAVVRAAFATRERVSWVERRTRLLVALAAAAVLVGGALSPPGQAVGSWLRDALVSDEPPVLRLPAAGQLLAVSAEGAWVVRSDGSKRLLGAYDDASWSPSARFVVATRGRELVALEPDGTVRWTVPRPVPLTQPRWAPSGFRIAYRADRNLRVVVGNGTGDRLLARGTAAAAPAWKPGVEHVLAFADASGRIHVVNTDTEQERWRSRPLGAVRQLAWSQDAARLLVVVSRGRLALYRGDGKPLRSIRAAQGRTVSRAAFAPRGHRFAYTEFDPVSGEAAVLLAEGADKVLPRQIYGAAGEFEDVVWSPDGRWLLVGWPTADKWLFLRAPSVRNLVDVSNVSEVFDPGRRGTDGSVRIAGWVLRR